MTELLSTGESVCRFDRRKLVIRNVRLQRPQMEETTRKERRDFLRATKVARWRRGEIVDINASMARSWARQMSGDIKWSICIYVYSKFMQYCNVSCAVHRPPYVACHISCVAHDPLKRSVSLSIIVNVRVRGWKHSSLKRTILTATGINTAFSARSCVQRSWVAATQPVTSMKACVHITSCIMQLIAFGSRPATSGLGTSER
jgi:hypothetical protein